MRRIFLWGSLTGVAGCQLEPTLVQINPDYGYVDGCTDVVLSGHSLGETATASIGGVDLPIVPATEDPTREEWAQDVGFDYFGLTPAAPGLEPGFYDVEMVVDGETLTLPQAFYYRACPSSFQIDSYSVADGAGATLTATTPELAEGDTFSLSGCGLDADVTAQIVQITGSTATATGTPTLVDSCGNVATAVGAPIPLVSDCGTANVHFSVPAGLTAGETYAIWFSDGTTTDNGTYTTITYYTTGTPTYGYVSACAPITFVGGGA